MACFNSNAADRYAAELGRLEEIDEARDEFCANFLKQELITIERYPMGDHRQDKASVCDQFMRRQRESCNSLDMTISYALAAIANMSSEDIEGLKTYSSPLADFAKAVRENLHNMYLEEAGGEFDERMRKMR